MIFDNDMANLLLYIVVAVGALHVGTLAVLDFGLVTDLLGASGDTETIIKGAIGAAGALNLIGLAMEVLD
jgi:uncharacterized membrane protein YuzA (DUF378 family)